VRRDVARQWELAAPHIAHPITPSGVEGNVVLLIMA